MLRSLFSGIAGLKTQQIKMDVIGNNISNVSTYGYKSARATFKDVYYQTSATATAAASIEEIIKTISSDSSLSRLKSKKVYTE